MDALKAAGNDADSQAMQRALVFVSRCQNLENEHTDTPNAAKVNDGGFYYSVTAGGQSASGSTRDGGLRSYGSMTYTGFKSLLYAGVDRKDPRIKAAFAWIQRYWRLDSNPNMPAAQSRAGIFYYYHTFAKALNAWGEPVITDRKGAKLKLVSALGEMGRLLTVTGNPRGAHDLLERALAVAEETGNRLAVLNTRSGLALTCLQVEDHEQFVEHMTKQYAEMLRQHLADESLEPGEG